MKSLLTLTITFMLSIPSYDAVAETLTSNQNDSWDHQSGKHEIQMTDRANRIIKWCADDSDHVRYASANLAIKGYHICGKLETIASCDAGGNKILSKNSNLPTVYRDCNVGQRIYIQNHNGSSDYASNGDTQDTSQHTQTTEAKSKETAPMSVTEKKQLEKDFAKLEKNQDPITKLLGAYLPLMTTFSQQNQNSNNRNIKSVKNTNSKNAMGIDQQTDKALKNLLGQNYQDMLQKLLPNTP